jgi:hypothetical protein
LLNPFLSNHAKKKRAWNAKICIILMAVKIVFANMTHKADKRLRRLLTFVLCAAVLVLACQVAAHWHASDHNESQCQMCHLSHTTTFLIAPGAQLPLPVILPARAFRQAAQLYTKQYLAHGASRAPPASFISA